MSLSSNCVKRIQYYEGRNQKFWKYCGIYCIKTMETSCVSCKKNTANKNKSKFIKTEEVHYVVFCSFNNIWNDWLKMNKIGSKFLLAGDKFMSKLHLRQPGFT